MRSAQLRRPCTRLSAALARRPTCCMLLPADESSVAAAAAAMRKAEAIALPTDTLYGLAAAATSAAGVRRLYEVKGRSASVPLAICLADPQDVCRFARTEHLPAGLLESLLPGPVTLLLERLPGTLCDELNPGLLRIGVRVPDSAFVRAVAREFGTPLALTSANRSGGQSSVSVAEFSELWHACAAVFDGGTLAPDRRGSTVVDLSARGAFSIVREGSARERVVATASQFGLAERPLS